MAREMRQIEIPAGHLVRITAHDGDLVVRGGGSVSVRAETVHLTQGEGSVTIEVTGDAILDLPAENPVLVDGRWDDGVVQGLTGRVELHGNEGDLVLRRLGEVSIHGTGGDLLADGLAQLHLEGEVQGDTRLRSVRECHCRRIHGDLAATEVEQLVAETIAGDVALARVARASLEHVDGDLSATAVESLAVSAIEGDGNLSEVGEGMLDHVAGDLQMRRVGAVQVGHVDGSVAMAEHRGPARIGAIQGDFEVFSPGGVIEATVHGDLTLRGAAAPGADGRFQVHGDALVSIQNAVRIRAVAGGDLRTSGAWRPVEKEGHFEGVLGEGEPQATIEIEAGGDIYIGPGRKARRRHFTEFDEVAREIEREMRHAAGEIEREVQRATAQVEREMRRAAVEIEREMGEFRRWPPGPPHPPAPPRPPGPVRDALLQWLRRAQHQAEAAPTPTSREDLGEETMAILRMVQEGKITAEEAEQLLRAMGAD